MTHSVRDTLISKDKRYVWHPFTQMGDWQALEPIIVDRAEGSYLIDVEGNRYLDGVSSLWVNVHGHRKREIDDAIRAQLEKVSHSTLLGLGNVPAIELAERLVTLAPAGLAKVFYSDSGSTAVEVALKMAYQYWYHRGRPEKRRFVALTEAYHGDTLGSVSVGGIDLFHRLFKPLLFDVLRVPTPYWYRCEQAPTPISCRDHCLRALEQLLEAHAHEIAAFVVEPLVQGAAGMIVQPAGYLREAAALCKKHDVLLICDEVATGFGRTGSLFACTQEEVSPDLLCVAKGISGGYLPLAATLATDKIYRQFIGKYSEFKTFFHGHTYTGNPLACAAALASLDLFERDDVLPKLAGKIQRLSSLLEERLAHRPHVGQIRQRGFMVGIELVRDRLTKSPYPFEEAIGAQVCAALRRRGVILRPLGCVLVLMPPLSISDDELEFLVDTTRDAVIEVTEA